LLLDRDLHESWFVSLSSPSIAWALIFFSTGSFCFHGFLDLFFFNHYFSTRSF